MEIYARKLKDELVVRSSSNPSYSLRAFARDLKLSPSFLSEVLKGKRRLSHESLNFISEKLGWSFNANIQFQEAEQVRQLTWLHLAILELSQRRATVFDVKLIAKTLGATRQATQMAVEALVERHIVTIRNGYLEPIPNRLLFGSDTSSSEVRRFHKEFMQLAQSRMELCDYDERELSSYVMSLSREQVQALRAAIRKFMSDLPKYTKGGPEDKEVYGLSAQLFPISKNKNLKEPTVHKKNKENKNV